MKERYTLTVDECHELLYRNGIDISQAAIRMGLQQGVFPFGVAIKFNQYVYIIYRGLLKEYVEKCRGDGQFCA